MRDSALGAQRLVVRMFSSQRSLACSGKGRTLTRAVRACLQGRGAAALDRQFSYKGALARNIADRMERVGSGRSEAGDRRTGNSFHRDTGARLWPRRAGVRGGSAEDRSDAGRPDGGEGGRLRTGARLKIGEKGERDLAVARDEEQVTEDDGEVEFRVLGLEFGVEGQWVARKEQLKYIK